MSFVSTGPIRDKHEAYVRVCVVLDAMTSDVYEFPKIRLVHDLVDAIKKDPSMSDSALQTYALQLALGKGLAVHKQQPYGQALPAGASGAVEVGYGSNMAGAFPGGVQHPGFPGVQQPVHGVMGHVPLHHQVTYPAPPAAYPPYHWDARGYMGMPPPMMQGPPRPIGRPPKVHPGTGQLVRCFICQDNHYANNCPYSAKNAAGYAASGANKAPLGQRPGI